MSRLSSKNCNFLLSQVSKCHETKIKSLYFFLNQRLNENSELFTKINRLGVYRMYLKKRKLS